MRQTSRAAGETNCGAIRICLVPNDLPKLAWLALRKIADRIMNLFQRVLVRRQRRFRSTYRLGGNGSSGRLGEVVGVVVGCVPDPVGLFGRLAGILASVGQVAAVKDNGGDDVVSRIGPFASDERNKRAEPVAKRRRIEEPDGIEPGLHPVPEPMPSCGVVGELCSARAGCGGGETAGCGPVAARTLPCGCYATTGSMSFAMNRTLPSRINAL